MIELLHVIRLIVFKIGSINFCMVEGLYKPFKASFPRKLLYNIFIYIYVSGVAFIILFTLSDRIGVGETVTSRAILRLCCSFKK